MKFDDCKIHKNKRLAVEKIASQYSEPTEPQYAEETKPIDAFETADSQTDFAEPVEAEETDKTGFESADNSDKDEYIPKDDNSDTDDTFKM